jgi:hypothetical protein
MKYALDANIISYYLKGNKTVQEKADKEAENDNTIIPPFACLLYWREVFPVQIRRFQKNR